MTLMLYEVMMMTVKVAETSGMMNMEKIDCCAVNFIFLVELLNMVVMNFDFYQYLFVVKKEIN